jgi:hypothetical protein
MKELALVGQSWSAVFSFTPHWCAIGALFSVSLWPWKPESINLQLHLGPFHVSAGWFKPVL